MSLLFAKIINRISLQVHRIKNKKKNITIISRDCIGGALYHQYGKQFLTPTINLFFSPEDFNFFCLYLNDYIDGHLIEEKSSNPFPTGLLCPRRKDLKNITINFMHYKTFDEARKKWNERKKRIKWDNIFVVSTLCYAAETKQITNSIVSDFNRIKYKKVVLVDQKYGFDDEFVVKKPDDCKENVWLFYSPRKILSWKKVFNDFDFDSFFNSN